MEDVVGAELGEHRIHPRAAADAGHHRLGGHVGEIARHHDADVVLRGLGLVDEHHLGGLELGHLPHDLRADAACGAGDQHPFAGQLLAHRFHVHADLLTGQQVLDADLREVHILVLAQHSVFDAGLFGLLDHEDFASRIDNHILNLLVLAEILHSQRTHQDSLDFLLADHLREVVVQVIDRHAHQLHILDARLMRDKARQLVLYGFLGVDVLG